MVLREWFSRLKKRDLYWISFLILLALFLANRGYILLTSEQATGTVVDLRLKEYVRLRFSGGHAVVPVIEFNHKGKRYFFKGTENTRLRTGKKVKVLFNPDNPFEAHHYSFMGFWFFGLFFLFLSYWAVASAIMVFVPEFESVY